MWCCFRIHWLCKFGICLVFLCNNYPQSSSWGKNASLSNVFISLQFICHNALLSTCYLVGATLLTFLANRPICTRHLCEWNFRRPSKVRSSDTWYQDCKNVLKLEKPVFMLNKYFFLLVYSATQCYRILHGSLYKIGYCAKVERDTHGSVCTPC